MERVLAASWASYLTFTVSGRRFALEISEVQEVVHLPELARVPDEPPFLEGFLLIEGHVVPVVALDRLFDLPPFERERYTTIILIGGRLQGAVGLLAEQIHGIVRTAEESLRPLPEHSVFNEAVLGIVPSEDGNAGLISMDRLLLQRERAALEAFRERERDRLAALDRPAVAETST